MHNHTASIKSRRFTEELERLWNERHRTLYRRLARSYPREFMKLLDSAIDSLVPKFTNSTRMLKEQLSAEGVSVWVSAGCLAEFARIASAAAVRMRQADEPYRSCLRREIATHSRFIREWTSSDKKFDQIQGGELVRIARKYALPRAWRLYEPVASVRGPAVGPQIAAQGSPIPFAGELHVSNHQSFVPDHEHTRARSGVVKENRVPSLRCEL